MKNYKELKVWQFGMDIVAGVYELARVLPKEEMFGLRSQLTRAAVSIPSNIAEGSSRGSEKDYSRFLEMALGSCFEVETQLLIAKQTTLLASTATDLVLALLQEEIMMLHAFIRRLRQNPLPAEKQ
ncbi:four helix bundle protein [Hymenobacter koreensis]